jgi:predicted nucleotidyltransferase
MTPGLRVKVVPPPVLFLLKVVAYLDDPHRRAKDLEDIHGLLKSYQRESDRMFSDAVFAAELPDVEFVPAFLLGTDIALFCRGSERAVVERFLDTMSDPESAPFLSLLRYEGDLEPSEQQIESRFRAFTKGLH